MNNYFKTNLKMLRLENGLGQIELAEKLKVSKGVISLWENGLREPTMSSLISVAKFFNVSIDYLVGLVNWKNKHLKNITALNCDVKLIFLFWFTNKIVY